MEPDEYISRVQEIAKINLKFAAFLSLLYITGNRIQEITKYRYEGKYEDAKEQEGKLVKSPMLYQDIFIDEDKKNNIKWLVINSRVEKKREHKEVFRQSFTLYDKGNYLWPLIEILESYLDQNFLEALGGEPLFTFSACYAREYIRKWLHLTPHVIRGMRAKHLVRYDGFDITALKVFFKWSDSIIAETYAASEESDIKRRLLGGS